MHRTVRRPLLLGALALALAAGGLEAQFLGSIEGTVTDAGGAGLARARVALASRETGVARAAVADRRGFYVVPALPPGVYDVTATRAGLGAVTRTGIRLEAGARLAIDLPIPAAGGEETLSAADPGIGAVRGAVASHLDGDELESLPEPARDFASLSLLAPGAGRETELGVLVLGGQRAVYTGLEIDGAGFKSGFFGYGLGGEATADGAPVVGLGSIEDLQVRTGFDPEVGGGAGSIVHLVTRRGGNRLAGSAFFSTRDDGLAADPRPSPLAGFLGRAAPPREAFEREAYGAAIGGPVRRDRTHAFWSWDHVDRSDSADASLARGTYDALRLRALEDLRFVPLLFGWQPEDDGTAAADAENGRTARKVFDRRLDSEILFARLDHRFDDSHEGFLRLNSSRYEFRSGDPDEESIRLEDTLALAAEVVSVIGPRWVHEARLQFARDDLDRLSARTGQFIESEIAFGDSGDVVGKRAFLPVRVAETATRARDAVSLLAASHELKLGLEVGRETAEQLFAPGSDGRYRFDTLQDFVDDAASAAEIFFGDVTFPNYDGARQVLALFAQDAWRPAARWSLRFGLRLEATRNPNPGDHLFSEGREIPDDTGNLAPRLAVAWTPDAAGRSVVRGGIGLFFARHPSSIFARQIRQDGLFPNAGRVTVTPGQVGFAPLGEPIDHRNPPPGVAVATGFVDPGFEDAEYLRASLSYDRELRPGWTGGVDLVWAEGENLLENVDVNRSFALDGHGRPIFAAARPLTRGDVAGTADDTPLGEVLAHRSIGESEYRAVTVRVDKRFSGRARLRAHYTRAEDRDTSSNEASVGDVTLLRADDPRFDFGFSDRDVRDRLVVSGRVELPLDFSLGGIYEYRSGRPFNPVDREVDDAYCPAALDFDCPDLRPVAGGRLLERNSLRNDSLDRLDLRLGRLFELGGRYRVDLFFEVFNVFDEAAFEVDDGAAGDRQRDPADEQFGLASVRLLEGRRMQLGARFRF